MARDDMSDELRELSSGGTLLRVLDQQGHTLYQPGFFLQYKVPVLAAGSQQTQYTTFRTRQDVYRMASRWIVAPDRRFLVTAAHSMREFEKSLRQFQFVLVLLSLLALALACAGGFFISRRALRPVDAITEAARTLSFNNLSTRLVVPRTNDELQRLSETLNAMLNRIEQPIRQMHQFTADASHELRTPLTLMRTAAEFSLRRERPREELVDALSQILNEVMRTSTLVDSLLLLSRTDSGIDDPTFTTVNLCDAMQQAVEQAMPFARDQNLTLEFHIPPAPLLVIGNHDLLRRAIYILLDNSIHYTPEGGLISATLSYAGEKAQLAVQDTGIGIGADQISHVFDRFWRADKVRSRNRGGAGLGLSIAQTIVNRHKGSIELTSQPGEGSRFSIVLPLDRSGDHPVSD